MIQFLENRVKRSTGVEYPWADTYKSAEYRTPAEEKKINRAKSDSRGHLVTDSAEFWGEGQIISFSVIPLCNLCL